MKTAEEIKREIRILKRQVKVGMRKHIGYPIYLYNERIDCLEWVLEEGAHKKV